MPNDITTKERNDFINALKMLELPNFHREILKSDPDTKRTFELLLN